MIDPVAPAFAIDVFVNTVGLPSQASVNVKLAVGSPLIVINVVSEWTHPLVLVTCRITVN